MLAGCCTQFCTQGEIQAVFDRDPRLSTMFDYPKNRMTVNSNTNK